MRRRCTPSLLLCCDPALLRAGFDRPAGMPWLKHGCAGRMTGVRGSHAAAHADCHVIQGRPDGTLARYSSNSGPKNCCSSRSSTGTRCLKKTHACMAAAGHLMLLVWRWEGPLRKACWAPHQLRAIQRCGVLCQCRALQYVAPRSPARPLAPTATAKPTVHTGLTSSSWVPTAQRSQPR